METSSKSRLTATNEYIRHVPGVYTCVIAHEDSGHYTYMVPGTLDIQQGDTVVGRNVNGLFVADVVSIDRAPKINLSKYLWAWIIDKVDLVHEAEVNKIRQSCRQLAKQDQAQFALHSNPAQKP